MFGLISKSTYESMKNGYEQTIARLEERITILETPVVKATKSLNKQQIIHPKLTSGFHGPVVISTDGSRRNEIWKKIPGTLWKVSNYSRVMDSHGRISAQTTNIRDDGRILITVPYFDANGNRRSITAAPEALMVKAFNPNTFELTKGCQNKFRYIDGNSNNKYLSNIEF